MKHPLLLSFAALLPGVSLAETLVPLARHLDIRSHFTGGEWSNVLRVDPLNPDPGQPPNEFFDPADAFLVLTDKLANAANPANSGSRKLRSLSSSSSFDFIGVSPGEYYWRATQGTPAIGDVWPGFDNDQPSSTFGSYVISDPRITDTSPRPWIRIALVDYEPPPGRDSHFSLWNSGGGPLKVWMSSFAPPADSSFYYESGAHTHMWWGFTSQGVHKVTLESSAFLGPGETNPTGVGDPFTLIFTVGTVARWQATWFDDAELDDPAISGMSADPDLDGLVNLLEYAFGTNPRVGGPVPVEEGLGFPTFSLVDDEGTLYETLTYPRRRAGDRLVPEVYQPEFSSNLSSPWDDTGVVTTAADFDPPLDALNAEWELVTSRRPAAPGTTHGFGRVDVTAGDGF